MSNIDPDLQKQAEEFEIEAKRLFRIVHGEWDGGSPMAYHARNPYEQLGWRILAGEFLKLKKQLPPKKGKKICPP